MKIKDPTKERKIMDVTIDIVHEKGLSGVKMSEVAKRVKISPSNLYIYFKNKEDLLLSTFFDIVKTVTKDFKNVDSKNSIFKKRIFDMFNHMIQTKASKIKEFSFTQQFAQSPYFRKEHFQEIDHHIKSVFDLLIEGQQEMILKDDVEVELIIALIDGTTSKLVALHNKGKIKLNQQSIEKSFRMVWDAIRQ